MRHREIHCPGSNSFGECKRAAREGHRRLGAPGDVDFEPGEVNTASKRLADSLLTRKASRIMLRRVRSRVAIGSLGLGEHTLTKPRVALESASNPPNLDDVDANAHTPSLEIPARPDGQAVIALFDGDGLGEVAWLINVRTAVDGYMIGKELHGDSVEDGSNKIVNLRNFDRSSRHVT